jgi:hypothetical protein
MPALHPQAHVSTNHAYFQTYRIGHLPRLIFLSSVRPSRSISLKDATEMILEANVKGINDTVCKAANLNRDGELTPLEQVSKLAMPPATAQNGGMASWIWTTMDWHKTYYLNVLLEIARARKTRLEIKP